MIKNVLIFFYKIWKAQYMKQVVLQQTQRGGDVERRLGTRTGRIRLSRFASRARSAHADGLTRLRVLEVRARDAAADGGDARMTCALVPTSPSAVTPARRSLVSGQGVVWVTICSGRRRQGICGLGSAK